jgi:hypothetical protein
MTHRRLLRRLPCVHLKHPDAHQQLVHQLHPLVGVLEHLAPVLGNLLNEDRGGGGGDEEDAEADEGGPAVGARGVGHAVCHKSHTLSTKTQHDTQERMHMQARPKRNALVPDSLHPKPLQRRLRTLLPPPTPPPPNPPPPPQPDLEPEQHQGDNNHDGAGEQLRREGVEEHLELVDVR